MIMVIMMMVMIEVVVVVVSGSLVQIALTAVRGYYTPRAERREKMKGGTARRLVYHLF